jgi:hypothetical protein
VDEIGGVRHRLTTDELLTRFAKRDHPISESTLKSALAELVRRRILDNRQDVRPNGYGFPRWN